MTHRDETSDMQRSILETDSNERVTALIFGYLPFRNSLKRYSFYCTGRSVSDTDKLKILLGEPGGGLSAVVVQITFCTLWIHNYVGEIVSRVDTSLSVFLEGLMFWSLFTPSVSEPSFVVGYVYSSTDFTFIKETNLFLRNTNNMEP